MARSSKEKVQAPDEEDHAEEDEEEEEDAEDEEVKDDDAEDGEEERLPCSSCQRPMRWSSYVEGAYKDGWFCETHDCGSTQANSGWSRWFCRHCLVDLCASCGETAMSVDKQLTADNAGVPPRPGDKLPISRGYSDTQQTLAEQHVTGAWSDVLEPGTASNRCKAMAVGSRSQPPRRQAPPPEEDAAFLYGQLEEARGEIARLKRENRDQEDLIHSLRMQLRAKMVSGGKEIQSITGISQRAKQRTQMQRLAEWVSVNLRQEAMLSQASRCLTSWRSFTMVSKRNKADVLTKMRFASHRATPMRPPKKDSTERRAKLAHPGEWVAERQLREAEYTAALRCLCAWQRTVSIRQLQLQSARWTAEQLYRFTEFTSAFHCFFAWHKLVVLRRLGNQPERWADCLLRATNHAVVMWVFFSWWRYFRSSKKIRKGISFSAMDDDRPPPRAGQQTPSPVSRARRQETSSSSAHQVTTSSAHYDESGPALREWSPHAQATVSSARYGELAFHEVSPRSRAQDTPSSARYAESAAVFGAGSELSTEVHYAEGEDDDDFLSPPKQGTIYRAIGGQSMRLGRYEEPEFGVAREELSLLTPAALCAAAFFKRASRRLCLSVYWSAWTRVTVDMRQERVAVELHMRFEAEHDIIDKRVLRCQDYFVNEKRRGHNRLLLRWMFDILFKWVVHSRFKARSQKGDEDLEQVISEAQRLQDEMVARAVSVISRMHREPRSWALSLVLSQWAMTTRLVLTEVKQEAIERRFQEEEAEAALQRRYQAAADSMAEAKRAQQAAASRRAQLDEFEAAGKAAAEMYGRGALASAEIPTSPVHGRGLSSSSSAAYPGFTFQSDEHDLTPRRGGVASDAKVRVPAGTDFASTMAYLQHTRDPLRPRVRAGSQLPGAGDSDPSSPSSLHASMASSPSSVAPSRFHMAQSIGTHSALWAQLDELDGYMAGMSGRMGSNQK